MSVPSINNRCVKVDEIVDLRHVILRDGLERKTAFFEGDDEPTTVHLAAELNGRVVGCCTLLHREWQGEPAWQLRGMAVDAKLQRGGVGRKILEFVDAFVRDDPHSNLLWCNARTPAEAFYERHGWTRFGDVFDVPTAGPHVKMTRRL